jgi:hypothetical protein
MSAEQVAESFEGMRLADIQSSVEGQLGRELPAGWLADFEADRAAAFEKHLAPVSGIDAVLEQAVAAGIPMRRLAGPTRENGPDPGPHRAQSLQVPADRDRDRLRAVGALSSILRLAGSGLRNGFVVVNGRGSLGGRLEGLFSPVLDWYVRPLTVPEYAEHSPWLGWRRLIARWPQRSSMQPKTSCGDRPLTKAERDPLLVRLWRKGRPEREIAEALDLAPAAVGPYVRELRDSEEDLPYRPPPRSVAERVARERRRDRDCATRARRESAQRGQAASTAACRDRRRSAT